MATKKKTAAKAPASAGPPLWETLWEERVTAFCKALNIKEPEFLKATDDLVGGKSEDALYAFGDDTLTPIDDIQAALKNGGMKVPTAQLRRHIGKLRTPEKPESSTASATDPALGAALPSLPDEESFLKALCSGGQLKVDRIAVISAIRTALANESGLFKLPQKILEKMELHADTIEEPVGNDYFKIRKLVASRRYGEVLSAFDATSRDVSESKKVQFLDRVNRTLMPQLRKFYAELNAWQQAWLSTATSTNAAAAMMMMHASGSNAQMPPGMLQPPDVEQIVSKAEAVVDSVNRVFAGVGLLISKALAHEAAQILELLNNSELPAYLGVASRELMLKELGVKVLSDHVRMEQGLAKFALGVMELPHLSGNQLGYVSALFQLGATLFPAPTSGTQRQSFAQDDKNYI